MKLYELIQNSVYYNIYFIYAENEYGECFKIDEGTWPDMLKDENEEFNLWWHVADEVTQWEVTPYGNIIIFVKDELYAIRAKDRGYSKGYVEQWDRLKPETRPYRYRTETEEIKLVEEESLKRLGLWKEKHYCGYWEERKEENGSKTD